MIKLYLDEDVHKKVAPALRIKGYDVVSAHEVKNWGLSGIQQLEYAVSNGRSIFTFNCGDFIRLHNKYLESKKRHFGILLSKQVPQKKVIGCLISFLYKHSAKDIKNSVFWM